MFANSNIIFTKSKQNKMEINLLLDILKYTLSGLLVVLPVYFLIKQQLNNTKTATTLTAKTLTKDVISLKLQAYERATLLIERINPPSMFIRLYTPGMSAIEMQTLILSEIRAEYQHNITQQLYLNTSTWALIKRVKEDTCTIINAAANQLPQNASAVELSKLVFARLSTLEESPYDLALQVIKNEMLEM